MQTSLQSPVLLFVLALALSPAKAALGATYTFSEIGTGSLEFGKFLTGLPSSIETDPFSGVATLTYNLLSPVGFLSGDLVITEPGSGARTDILRFSSFQGGSIFVFSDISDGADSLADVIDLSTMALQTNVATVEEVGPEEGPNGVIWTPASGQPGYISGPLTPITYNFISDAAQVPEAYPSGAVIVLGCATAVAWRRLLAKQSRIHVTG